MALIPDKLYDLAFAFKKSKLWDVLKKKIFFALSLPATEQREPLLLYCNMGEMEDSQEGFSINVYPGKAGICSMFAFHERLAQILEEGETNSLEEHLELLCLDAMILKFVKKKLMEPPELEEVRAYSKRTNVKLNGAYPWPQFRRMRPRCLPNFLQDSTEHEIMAEALEATLEVARIFANHMPEQDAFTENFALGASVPLLCKNPDGTYQFSSCTFPESTEETYPEAMLLNELALKRLHKQKKRSGVWACEIFVGPESLFMDDTEEWNEDDEDFDEWDENFDDEAYEDTDIPGDTENAFEDMAFTDIDGGEEEDTDDDEEYPTEYYPLIQIVVDVNEGEILDAFLCQYKKPYETVMPNQMLELMNTYGKPVRLLVKSPRTECLYGNLMKTLGIPLVHTDQCECLDELIAACKESLQYDDEDEEWEDINDFLEYSMMPFDDANAEESVLSVMQVFQDLLKMEISPGKKNRLAAYSDEDIFMAHALIVSTRTPMSAQMEQILKDEVRRRLD